MLHVNLNCFYLVVITHYTSAHALLQHAYSSSASAAEQVMPAHICRPLASLATLDAHRPTAICCGLSLTGQQLHDQVAAWSHALAHGMCIAPGQRVALLGDNTLGYFIALLACADAGAIACPLNTRWTGEEVAAALRLVGPTALLADAAHLPEMARMLPASCPSCSLVLMPALGGEQEAHTHISNATDATHSGWHAAWCTLPPLQPVRSAAAVAAPPELQLLSPADGTAIICFTSGTTGAPKGAMLSHAALHHQVRATAERCTTPPPVSSHNWLRPRCACSPPLATTLCPAALYPPLRPNPCPLPLALAHAPVPGQAGSGGLQTLRCLPAPRAPLSCGRHQLSTSRAAGRGRSHFPAQVSSWQEAG